VTIDNVQDVFFWTRCIWCCLIRVFTASTQRSLSNPDCTSFLLLLTKCRER